MNFRIMYTATKTGRCHLNRARRGSIVGAANTLHKIHASKNRQLVAFTINEQEYDMPWMATRKEIVARLEEIIDFHEAFYGEAA